MVKVYLNVRNTNLAWITIVSHSDPILLCGKGIAQRKKGTLGITG